MIYGLIPLFIECDEIFVLMHNTWMDGMYNKREVLLYAMCKSNGNMLGDAII